MAKFLKRFVIGSFMFLAAVVMLVWFVEPPARDRGAANETTSNPAQQAAQSVWVSAWGNLWTGVTLYFGPERTVVGKVLGGSDGEINLGGIRTKGVLIEMPDGNQEWKSRKAIAMGDWFIRRNDPALAQMNWTIYQP